MSAVFRELSFGKFEHELLQSVGFFWSVGLAFSTYLLSIGLFFVGQRRLVACSCPLLHYVPLSSTPDVVYANVIAHLCVHGSFCGC